MAGACAKHLAVAVVAAAALAGPAAAQTVPEGQSCGGLLCDMGMFGHKTGPRSEASAPAAAALPAPVPAPTHAAAEPKGAATHKPKRVAKIAAPKVIAPAASARVAEPAPAMPAVSAPATSAPATSVPATSTLAAPGTAIASAPVAATPKAAAAPADIFVPLTPYASPGPSRVTLQAITPGY